MLAILERPAGSALATVAQARARFAFDDSLGDERLAALIDDRSGAVEAYCRRQFGRMRYRLTTRGGRDRILLAPPGPIVSIESITASDVPLDVAGAALSGPHLLRRVDGSAASWPCGEMIIEFTAGYRLPGESADAAPPLPAAVSAACMDLVSRAWAARDRDPALRREMIVGVSQFDYDTPGAAGLKGGLPVDIAALLDAYVWWASA